MKDDQRPKVGPEVNTGLRVAPSDFTNPATRSSDKNELPHKALPLLILQAAEVHAR